MATLAYGKANTAEHCPASVDLGCTSSHLPIYLATGLFGFSCRDEEHRKFKPHQGVVLQLTSLAQVPQRQRPVRCIYDQLAPLICQRYYQKKFSTMIPSPGLADQKKNEVMVYEWRNEELL
ncbi:hypothetical protein POM88_001098 [Heracleum sosnowskyi]|uniref:Uncharacterized protein n=1 Tax=Heracleum sosnowskyi TaxID=360622 RepID=A0AAD8NBF9_9APIA|nr:hypothetical protein POM88_001098 [Heracleum sosnowskyi]